MKDILYLGTLKYPELVVQPTGIVCPGKEVLVVDQRLLDQEWVTLVKEARDLGLSIEVVREFLENYNEKLNWGGEEEKPNFSSGFSSIFGIPKIL